MQFVFDHALAFICGTALLVTALSLQTRSRLHDVQEVVSNSAYVQAVSMSSVVAEDLDNLLSEAQSTVFFGSYLCRLTRDATDTRTQSIEIPTYVRTAPGGTPIAAQVRYRLVADGDSVQTANAWVHTYQLEREVDLGMGFEPPAIVGVNLVDFDVTFRGRASEATSGTPPLRFSQVGLDVAVAVQDLEGGRRYHNVARISHVSRPPNLSVSF